MQEGMNAYDFVQLAFLLFDGGTIRGKAKLQKTIYFLGVLTSMDCDTLGTTVHCHVCQFPADLKYMTGVFGPHSFAVTRAIGRLVADGFLDRTKTAHRKPVYDASDFEGRVRHDYVLNEEGRSAAERKEAQYGSLVVEMRKATERLQAAGDADYVILSAAAKAYHALYAYKWEAMRPRCRPDSEVYLAWAHCRNHPFSTTIATFASYVQKFDWEVSEEVIQKAADYLQRLGLVFIK